MAMRGGRSDESYELEGVMETQTAKAYLVEFTNVDKKVWVPKSQCEMLEEPDFNGKTTFRVRGWFVEKEGLV